MIDQPEVVGPPEEVWVAGRAIGIEHEPIQPKDRGPHFRRNAVDIARGELARSREEIEAEVQTDTSGEKIGELVVPVGSLNFRGHLDQRARRYGQT